VLRHGIVGREPLVRVVVAVEAAAVLADVEDARDDSGPVQIARHLLANVRLAARRQANHPWVRMAGTRCGQAFRGRGREAGGDPVGHAVPTTILLSPRGSGGFSGILAELRWSTDARRMGMEGLDGLGGLTARKNIDAGNALSASPRGLQHLHLAFPLLARTRCRSPPWLVCFSNEQRC